MAWMLLAAARWLDRHSTSPGPRAPDPQTTIYDHITTEETSP
jgi:hypothetical protein